METQVKYLIVDPSNVRIEMAPRVVGLPPDIYVEYFGVLPSGKDFIIFRPRENWDYDSFVLVVAGKSEQVKKVVRYRDGGTTDINTSIGAFHFPSPFKRDEQASLDGALIPTIYERTE